MNVGQFGTSNNSVMEMFHFKKSQNFNDNCNSSFMNEFSFDIHVRVARACLLVYYKRAKELKIASHLRIPTHLNS
jgi:hypothetical protein